MGVAYNSNVLNQRGAPAMYEDLIANRPAAGYVGRVFIGTDNFNIYRDNGTTWNQLGGSASGTVTSITGTANQVIASSATGAVTLSLPQNIGISNSPTFAGITLSGLSSAGLVINSSAGVISTSSGTGFIKMAAGVVSYDNSTYISLTALSASSPLSYNNVTGVFSIQVATGAQNGYLSSSDWTTFNGKQSALNGTGFVKISGTTISYDNSTYISLTALSASSPLSYNNVTGAFSIQVATGSQNGYLSSADWTTFNGKQATISGGTGVTVAGNVVSIGQSVATSASPTFAGITLSALSSAGLVINSAGGVLSTSSGTGFVKMSAGVLSYDNSSYISLTALSASSPLLYNNATGVFSIQVATGAQNGYLSSSDWTTFNSKQAALSAGTGVTISGGVVSIGQSVATSASPTFAGMTLTGALSGTSASFSSTIGSVQGNFIDNFSGVSRSSVGNTSGGSSAIGGFIIKTDAGTLGTLADFSTSYSDTKYRNKIFLSADNAGVALDAYGSSGAITMYTGASETLALTINSSQQVQINAATASTAYNNGALVISGGVGVAGNIYGNGTINAAGNITVATSVITLNATNGMVYSSALSPAGYNYTSTTALNSPAFYYGYTGGGTATFTVPNPSINNQLYYIKNVSGTTLTVNAFSGCDIINIAGSSVSSLTFATGIGGLFYSNGGTHTIQIC